MNLYMSNLISSNMLGTFIFLYIFLFIVLFVSFLNIYSVDKYEFQNNRQMCFEFKRNMFFIFQFSKNKRIISKKTFIFEIIGYFLTCVLIISFSISLLYSINLSFIILAIMAFIVFVYGCITGNMYRKIKK